MSGPGSYLLQQTRALGMTRQLGQAIGLLKFSNRDLAAFLAFHAATNPFLSVQAAKGPSDDPARREGQGARGPGGASGGGAEDFAARGPGLEEHVRREIGLLRTSARERAIAEHFIRALEPTGWLGRPTAEIAADAGCSPDEAEAVLARLQGIEPPGLFARDLAECLRLQAQEAGVLGEELALVLGHLPMLARGQFDQLAELCGCNRKALLAHFDTIRSLNPKPGTLIAVEAPRDAPPDLIVTDLGGSFEVEMNRSTLPTIAVTGAEGLSAADQAMLDAARAVARAVERRNIVALKIAVDLVRRQAAFLRHGPEHLKPLVLREVAEAVGVSESTVSRVTSSLQMDAPRGPVALKDFFSGVVPTRDGPVSAVAVRARISELIRGEDPAHPLSDADLAAHFERLGIRLARRTVAKYRDALRIPGSAGRRRRAASHPH